MKIAGILQGQPSRRARILAAAETEFAAGGLAGARVERIAARARVNKQLVFHYFGSKAGLYEAVAAEVAGRLLADAASGATPWKRLRVVISTLSSAAEEQRGLLTPAWRRQAIERAHEVLSAGQAQGFVRDTIEPARIAELVVAAAVGWATAPQATAEAAAALRERYCDLVMEMVSDYCAWR